MRIFFYSRPYSYLFDPEINTSLYCVYCSSVVVVVCMKSNPSIKRVVCSHIFSIQFGKVQQKPCIEKSTLGSPAAALGRQADRQAGRQGERNHLFQFDSLFAFGP